MNIQAAVAREAHRPLSIENVTLDDVRAGEVLVRLVATGVCHTDLAVIHRHFPAQLPMVLGHEGAGIVERVGAGIDDLQPGDPVVLTFDSCGGCASCGAGHPVYCDDFPARNFSGRRADGSSPLSAADGSTIHGCFFAQSSFANYAIARHRNVIKVRGDAPLERLGPLSCGFQTGSGTILNVLRPTRRSRLAIFGAGAVGFAAMFAAKVLGCERIVVIDRVASRLQLAIELGASDVIDTSRDDLSARLSTFGPLDFVVETTGVPSLATAAVKALAVQGTCAIIGASAEPDMIVPMSFMIPGRVLRGVRIGDADPAQLIPWLVQQHLEGRFPIERLIRYYDFGAVNEALAATRSGETIKAVLRFP